jgi:hypothetical protein
MKDRLDAPHQDRQEVRRVGGAARASESARNCPASKANGEGFREVLCVRREPTPNRGCLLSQRTDSEVRRRPRRAHAREWVSARKVKSLTHPPSMSAQRLASPRRRDRRRCRSSAPSGGEQRRCLKLAAGSLMSERSAAGHNAPRGADRSAPLPGSQPATVTHTARHATPESSPPTWLECVPSAHRARPASDTSLRCSVREYSPCWSIVVWGPQGRIPPRPFSWSESRRPCLRPAR